jgi:hypothetical protein
LTALKILIEKDCFEDSAFELANEIMATLEKQKEGISPITS